MGWDKVELIVSWFFNNVVQFPYGSLSIMRLELTFIEVQTVLGFILGYFAFVQTIPGTESIGFRD